MYPSVSVVALEAGLPHPKLTSNPCNVSPHSALTKTQAARGSGQMSMRCSVERAVVAGVRGSLGPRSSMPTPQRSSGSQRRTGESNLELSARKILASASSEADGRTTCRSEPTTGALNAR